MKKRYAGLRVWTRDDATRAIPSLQRLHDDAVATFEAKTRGATPTQ